MEDVVGHRLTAAQIDEDLPKISSWSDLLWSEWHRQHANREYSAPWSKEEIGFTNRPESSRPQIKDAINRLSLMFHQRVDDGTALKVIAACLAARN